MVYGKNDPPSLSELTQMPVHWGIFFLLFRQDPYNMSLAEYAGIALKTSLRENYNIDKEEYKTQ